MKAILKVNLDSLLGLNLGVFARTGTFVNVRTVNFTGVPSVNYFDIQLPDDSWVLVHKSALFFVRR